MPQRTRQPRGLLVTGTSTDAGKTVVAGLLCRLLPEASYYKPVQTGCTVRNGRLIPPDTDFVRHALPDRTAETGLLFRHPVAPVLASRLEHRPLTFADILAKTRRFLLDHPPCVVEGAGGLAVPLDTTGRDYARLAAALRLPLVVAGPATLGAINHFRLTCAYARHHRLAVRGLFLVCRRHRPDPVESDNAKTLSDLLRIPAFLIPRIPRLERNPRHGLDRLADLLPDLTPDLVRMWIHG